MSVCVLLFELDMTAVKACSHSLWTEHKCGCSLTGPCWGNTLLVSGASLECRVWCVRCVLCWRCCSVTIAGQPGGWSRLCLPLQQLLRPAQLSRGEGQLIRREVPDVTLERLVLLLASRPCVLDYAFVWLTSLHHPPPKIPQLLFVNLKQQHQH